MKIAIAGYGAEGKASYAYWNTPEHDVVIVDERDIPMDELPFEANSITGEDAFSRLNGFDMVVRTAGLAPRKIMTDGVVWSSTNEFFARCAEKDVPIIGVTGTKGKGTTCSLIASILRAAGKTVHVVGNIGTPALEVLQQIQPSDIVVYELSSFQLWDIDRSPHIAVVLHIEADHLDVHTNFDDYVAAKTRIATEQTTTDRIVYAVQNEWSRQIAEASVGQRLPYPSDQAAHIRGSWFWYGDQELCPVDTLQVLGVHNQYNACAAITAAWPWVQDGQVIAEGLRSFSGLPHRVELVREHQGILWYDDSFASAPPATIVAIEAVNRPVVLIAGGYDRGLDYATFAAQLAASSLLEYVILIGETGPRIAKELQKQNFTSYETMADGGMVEIVARAAARAQDGQAVLLSPGCASFDMFENFTDRGNQFQEAVRAV